MAASYSSSGGTAGNAINNTVGAGLSLAVGQEEHASSVTRSGISAGEIVIRDGDASSLEGLDRSVTDLQQEGLEDIFDARKVSERMEMGQVAGEVAFRAVGDITQALTREYTQAKMQAEAAQGLLNNPSVSDAERQVLQQALDSANATMAAHQGQYDLWKDGGTGKTLVHAAAGALVASLGGGDALGGALGAGAAELGRSLTANESRLVQELVSVGLGAVGGSSGAAAGLAGEKFNRQLHPEEMEFIKDKASEYAAEIGISVEEAEQHLLRGALMNNDDDWNELLTLYVPEHVEHYQDAFGWLAGKAGESNFQIRDNVGVIQPAFTSSAEERANETLHARQVLESPASLAMYLDSANITRGEATVGELLRAYLKHPGAEGEAFLEGMGNSLKGYAAFVDPATYRALASLTREMATDPKGTTAQVINGLQDLGIDAGADVMIDLLQMDLQDFRDGYAELQGGIALEVIAELATLGTVSAVTAAKYGLRGGATVARVADGAEPVEDLARATEQVAKRADDIVGDFPRREALDGILPGQGLGASASPGGNICKSEMCKAGVRVSPETPQEKDLAARISRAEDVENRGRLTEELLAMVAERQGYTIIPGGKYGSNKGFDLVMKARDGNVVIVMDGKQMANGSVRLSRHGAGGNVQLTPKWLNSVLGYLPKGSPARAEVTRARESGRLVTAVGAVDRETGEIIVARVNDFYRPPGGRSTRRPIGVGSGDR